MDESIPPSGPSSPEYHYSLNGQRFGPVSKAELKRLLDAGGVGHADLVWTEGMPEWAPAHSIEGLCSTPPPTPTTGGGVTPLGPRSTHQGGSAWPPATYSPKSIGTLYGWWLGLQISGLVLVIFLIGILPLIAAIVFWYILLYRAWRVIQDGQARTTPGKAVGFCFIPFFNFYWQFVALHGLAKDMNQFIERHELPVKGVSEGVALWICILVLVSLIPYVGWLATLGLLVLFFIFTHHMQRATREILTELQSS
jgi:uncharacterized protein DUF4339